MSTYIAFSAATSDIARGLHVKYDRTVEYLTTRVGIKSSHPTCCLARFNTNKMCKVLCQYLKLCLLIIDTEQS